MSADATRRLAFVLGWPVEHSKSPALHNAAFAALGVHAHYETMAVPPSGLAAAIAGLRDPSTLGASVTVPHKSAVLQYCDSLSDAAKAIGAVNTLEFCSDQSIRGHNTDAPGYVRSLLDLTGHDFVGKRAVLLGGGGAARAIAFGLQESGVATLQLIARSPAKVRWMQAQAWQSEVLRRCLQDCDLLVDCTSMGLSPESEKQIPAAIPLEALPADATVSTLVYHRETQLLAGAKKRGLQTVDGRGMLLFQGAIAFEIWTGQPAPIDVMRSALLA